jgi:hypothetical protein
MKDFSLEYDVRAHAFSIEHTDILKQEAKNFKEALVIKPFQVAVQVAIDKDVRVANPDAVEQEMLVGADELAEEVRQEIADLNEKIQKLKKEEAAGNKTASAEADKLVKASKKKLDKLAGEFGAVTRTAVEKMLTSQNRGTKVKGRSASRTGCRGLELEDDFFDESNESAQSEPYFGKLAQGLAASGKEMAKLTLEEKSVRRSLGDEILRVQKLVEAKRTGKSELDIQQFAKDNAKDARGLEATAQKYIDFVNAMNDKLDAAAKILLNFQKIIDHAENMEDQKEIEKETEAYETALVTVQSTIEEKLAGGKAALRLFKDDYGTGTGWTSLEAELDKIKAAAKSGAKMQDSGAALAKYSKK